METTDRFWSKVARRGDDECWPWIGHAHQRGYGIYWHSGKNVRAHRHALTIVKGPPPNADSMALHACDNPPCCNPFHLRWGTAKENVDDRDLRMRGVRANAKIDETTVAKIYRLRLAGFTAPQISENLHLSRHLVMNVYTGRAWSHLLGADGNPTLAELRASKPRDPRIAANRVVTDAMVDAILQARMAGASLKEIAANLSLPIGTVSPVFCGLAFTDRLGVDGNPTFDELRAARSVHPSTKLAEDDIAEIRQLLLRGYTGRTIAAKYGVSAATVSNIRKGKR